MNLDNITLGTLIQLAGNIGFGAVVLILWWSDQKTIRKILDEYKKDMVEQRKMYADNVTLVKQTQEIAKDLKEIYVLNTQALTRVCDFIKSNHGGP